MTVDIQCAIAMMLAHQANASGQEIYLPDTKTNAPLLLVLDHRDAAEIQT